MTQAQHTRQQRKGEGKRNGGFPVFATILAVTLELLLLFQIEALRARLKPVLMPAYYREALNWLDHPEEGAVLSQGDNLFPSMSRAAAESGLFDPLGPPLEGVLPAVIRVLGRTGIGGTKYSGEPVIKSVRIKYVGKSPELAFDIDSRQPINISAAWLIEHIHKNVKPSMWRSCVFFVVIVLVHFWGFTLLGNKWGRLSGLITRRPPQSAQS